MNRIMVAGRLTADPEAKQTTGGKNFARVTIASRKGRDDATFIPCSVYGKAGEVLFKHAKKGDYVAVSGQLSSFKPDDAKYPVLYVHAWDMDLGGKANRSNDDGAGNEGGW